MSEPALPTVSLDPTFNRARHVKYHLRCLKTLLPTPYTTTDANRMSLATFTVCALDLLSELIPNTTEAERQAYIDWIYRCQHPDGGFRGFTGTNFSHAKKREQVNEAWDTANLAGTFFAFMALVVLGDGLERVRRRECLEWVRRLQLQDGSFGEGRGEGGNVVGSGDLRYAYFAAATRWVLDGGREGKVDIDVDGLVGFVRRSQVCRVFLYGLRGSRGAANRYTTNRHTTGDSGRPHITRPTVCVSSLSLPSRMPFSFILILRCRGGDILWDWDVVPAGQAPAR